MPALLRWTLRKHDGCSQHTNIVTVMAIGCTLKGSCIGEQKNYVPTLACPNLMSYILSFASGQNFMLAPLSLSESRDFPTCNPLPQCRLYDRAGQGFR